MLPTIASSEKPLISFVLVMLMIYRLLILSKKFHFCLSHCFLLGFLFPYFTLHLICFSFCEVETYFKSLFVVEVFNTVNLILSILYLYPVNFGVVVFFFFLFFLSF